MRNPYYGINKRNRIQGQSVLQPLSPGDRRSVHSYLYSFIGIILLTAFFSTRGYGDTFTWALTANGNGVSNPVNANITLGGVAKGTNLVTQSFNATNGFTTAGGGTTPIGWNEANLTVANANNAYVEVSITTNCLVRLDISQISFITKTSLGTITTGNSELKFIKNGLTALDTLIGNFPNNATTAGDTQVFSSLAIVLMQNDTITFRIYAAGIGGNTRSLAIKNFIVTGTATTTVLPTNPGNPTSNSPQCGTVTITRTGSPPAGVTWFWQGTSCGTNTSNGSGATFNATSSGTYFIRAQDNITGCWSAACGSVSVTVNAIPADPGNPSSNSPQCGTVVLTRTGSPPGGDTWFWQNTSCGTSTANGSGTTFNATATGTYFIRAQNTSTGCWSTGCGSVAVTVNPVPADPGIPTSNSPQCGTVTITRTGTPPAGVTWFWQTTSCGTSTANGSGTTFNATSSGTYFIRAQDNVTGCWSAACGSVAVIVNPIPSDPGNPTSNSPQCGIVTITRSGTPTGGVTWFWQNTSCGTSTANGSGSTFSASSSGTYFIRAQDNATGCWSTGCGSVAVVVNPGPADPGNPISNAPQCGNVTLTRNGTPPANISWFWQGTNCGTNTGLGSGNTFTASASGTYFVRAQNTNTGCWSSGCGSVVVTIISPSVAPTSITGNNTICNGQNTTLTRSGGTLGTNATFEWYSGSCGGTSEGSGNNITVSPTVTTTYFLRAEGTAAPCTPNTSCVSVVVTVNNPSVAPTGISGTNIICNGQSTTLTQTGGTLGTNASYFWYSGSCGGTFVATGNSITVTPTVTTTYFVRAENTANPCTGNTGCATVTVTVNNPSVAPTGISGNSTICNGQSTTLTQTGGTLGTNATYEWYTGSCGGTSAGSGNSITVSPTVTTTYFVRAENTASPCTGNTSCATVTVTVNDPSSAPTGISGNNLICNGQSTTLTQTGGTLGTNATYEWYSGGCGGTFVGSGPSITISPTVTTTYFVRAENTANPCTANTPCESVTVTVNNPSVAPTGITGPASICNGSSATLTLQGGSLGTGGSFVWYSGTCGGTAEGTGNSITVNPATDTVSVTTNYFVRAEGPAPCPLTTTCATLSLTVDPIPYLTNSSFDTICSGTPWNYTIMPSFYTNVTYNWTTTTITNITGNQNGGGVITIPDVLTNATTNQQIQVPYTVTLTYTNGANTCDSSSAVSVLVNPTPPAPEFSTIEQLQNSQNICGGSEFLSFFVDQSGAFSYSWTTSPPDVQVNLSDTSQTPNDSSSVIITFPDLATSYNVNIQVVANNTDALGKCPSDPESISLTVSPGGITERPIVLRQPGNLLIYLDNSAVGYQWGYDSLPTLRPSVIKDQVFQIFAPVEKESNGSFKFLDSTANKEYLDTASYLFWVMVYQLGEDGDTCMTKVYYNGSFAKRPGPVQEAVSTEIMTVPVPNPNQGIFDLRISGNIYGLLTMKIYNAIGQKTVEKKLEKTEDASVFRLDCSYLENGLYLIQVSDEFGFNQYVKLLID